MGQTAARPPPPATHGHLYLVVGNPPIRYTRNRRGPNIFHVEIPNTPDTVTKSETIECPAILSTRDLAVQRSEDGAVLHFSYVVHVEPNQRMVSVNVFLGANVTFHPNSEEPCVRLEPMTPGRPFLIFEDTVRHNSSEAHSVVQKDVPLSADAQSVFEMNLAQDTSDPLARRQAHVVVVLSYAETKDGMEKTHQYITLLNTAETIRDVTKTSRIALNISHQYLQLGSRELFDLEGLYGDADADPLSPDPKGEAVGGVATADEEGMCIVCWTNPVDTTCIPCRHYCLCSACAAEVKRTSNKCPCCRRGIERLMRR